LFSPQSHCSISLIIPAYNEEALIVESTLTSLKALSRLTDTFEIILINDASTDNTSILCDRLSQKHNNVRVWHNPINLGAGLSLRIGWSMARYDLVIHNGADVPFDLRDLKNILPMFPKWDIVVISRRNRTAHSPWRKITSLMNNLLIRMLFRPGNIDMNFVQIYKRSCLQRLSIKAQSPAFVTPEAIIRAKYAKLAVTSVTKQFGRRHAGKAKYGKFRDIIWTLADMLSLRIEIFAGKL